jgi:hypothetical protein
MRRGASIRQCRATQPTLGDELAGLLEPRAQHHHRRLFGARPSLWRGGNARDKVPGMRVRTGHEDVAPHPRAGDGSVAQRTWRCYRASAGEPSSPCCASALLLSHGELFQPEADLRVCMDTPDTRDCFACFGTLDSTDSSMQGRKRCT